MYSNKFSFANNGSYFVNPKPIYINQFANTKKLKGYRELINDKQAAKKFGVEDLEKFTYWAWRSCGIAAVQMILKTKIKNFSVSTYDLVKMGLKYSGYDIKNDFGWYHKSLCKILREYGLTANIRKYASKDEIAYLIGLNHCVISSVKASKEGHLILIYGVKVTDTHVVGFWYHDPSTFNKEGRAQFIETSRYDKISKRSIIECF